MAEPAVDYEGFEEARAIRRRRRRRIALPLAVVAVMLAALVGIVVNDYHNMHDDALTLSRGVITNLQGRIETEVDVFLRPIPGIVRVSRDLLAGELQHGIPQQEAVAALGIGMLRNAPQLTALYLGTADGEFVMAKRARHEGQTGYELKEIHATPEAADGFVITLTRYDLDGTVVASERLPWDRYDPRQRPWYRGAAEAGGLSWTDIYPFFTDRAAGITASLPLSGGADGARAVIGADVALQDISAFLGSLTIGKSGLALIIDGSGRVIAHPKAELIRQDDDGQVRLTEVGDLGNPVVTRAFDRYRVEGHGRHDFTLGDARYISSAWSLRELVQRDWTILIVVPEDDFVGFVVDNVRQTLVLGLSVIALAALLAALMIRQGLRADRDATRILERQVQIDAQGQAFGVLAADDRKANSTAATESVCLAARVRRVSLWHWDATARDLVCHDCYDRETEGHTQGTRLGEAEHGGLFETLARGESVVTLDAATDPHLAALDRQYLAPLGCRALLATPVMVGGEWRGAVWFEDAATRHDWPRHTRSFAYAVARLLALHLGTPPATPRTDGTATPRQSVEVPAATAQTLAHPFLAQDIDSGLGSRRAAAFVARLARQASGGPGGGISVVERLPVMALRLTDAIVLAAPDGAPDADATVTVLLRELQSAAADHEIAYLKFFSDQVIASIDPNDDPTHGLHHLVEFALQTRTICETVFARHRVPLAFCIGIDQGPAIGSLISREPPSFAFWGEAVQTASKMADTGMPGTIQVTESVYQAVRDAYLFQLRGHHFLEGLGEFSTYLLGGRL